MLNQEAISELANDSLFKKERLTPEELDSVVKMISHKLDVRMIPGNSFEYVPPSADGKAQGMFIYNRQQLLGMHPLQGPGLAFHNIGHALFSDTKIRIGDFANKTADELNKKAGHNVIAGNGIPELINAAEDERMEKLVRQEWPNLDNNFLPRHDGGYREKSFKKRLEYLQTVTQPGTFIEDPQSKQQKSAYWDRAAVAFRGLVSGAITRDQLPKDMPWTEELCNQIKALGDAPTCTDMINQFPPILEKIATYREEPPPPCSGGGEGEGEGEGEGQAEGQGGGGQGKGQGQGQQGKGQGQCQGHSHGDGSKCSDIHNESNGGASRNQPKKADGDYNFIRDGGHQAGFDNPDRHIGFIGPSWGAVRSTVQTVIGPIKKTIDRFFKDNEVADKDTGHRSGRFNARAYMRSHFGKTGATNYFSRRTITSQKNYAVQLLIDLSGSMQCEIPGGGNYADVFGTGEGIASRWVDAVTQQARQGAGAAAIQRDVDTHSSRSQLACRMTVAIMEALSRFKEVKTAISGYMDSSSKGGYFVMKTFRQPLNAELKQHCMNTLCKPGGGTVLAPALAKISDEFRKVQANDKLLIILTDGALGDGYGGGEDPVNKAVKRLKHEGVSTVVLTVGCDASEARQFVPKDHADQVTDDNIGNVMAKHLKRMTRGR